MVIADLRRLRGFAPLRQRTPSLFTVPLAPMDMRTRAILTVFREARP